ncbi:MAG: GntR family transcriptional regulator [Clostridia bacterium]|nr:GntR family transcriptional regulator [Clostridia bacterium]
MFHINYRSGEPIYMQIYNEVIKEISLGLLIPQEKLATVRELASELGINPNTVSKAYQLLESNGYIYSVVGKGSFVSDNVSKLAGLKENIFKDLRKLTKEAVSLGVTKNEMIKLVDEVYGGE